MSLTVGFRDLPWPLNGALLMAWPTPPDPGRGGQPRPGERNGNREILKPEIVNGIAIVVTVIWAASFVADFLIPTYSPPATIHAAFMLIVGAVFGSQFLGGGNRP